MPMIKSDIGREGLRGLRGERSIEGAHDDMDARLNALDQFDLSCKRRKHRGRCTAYHCGRVRLSHIGKVRHLLELTVFEPGRQKNGSTQ